MPAGKPETSSGGGKSTASNSKTSANSAPGKITNRPPWIKDGPMPMPMPQAPWTLNKRGSIIRDADIPPAEAPNTKKTSSIKIVPAQPAENGTASNAKDPHTFERPKLREVPKATPPKEQKLQSREIKVPITVTSTRRESKDLPQKVHIDTSKKKEEPVPETNRRGSTKDEGIPKVTLRKVNRDEPKEAKKEETLPKVELRPVKKSEPISKDGPLDKATPAERNAIVRQESMKKVGPPPPPMPPPPPPPPPMELSFKRDPLSRSQLEQLESLRARPRKRPDWGAMMKDIETGKKLKHVQCNDRSKPLLPENKAKGQFIYESETANLHNQLLKQIQAGANLKHVKTNDRSRPILQGLRKFRRQMTIEEQIIKSQSMASMPPEEVEEEADEMDDIDKIRDDLQSTKQMLALELRNKEAQVRENKRLLARLANLEAELEKFKNAPPPVNDREQTPTPTTPPTPMISLVDDKLVKTLKNEAEEARKTAEEMEKKYHQTADELFTVKTDMDEIKKQNMILEKKLQQAMQGGGSKRQSISDRRESVKQEEEEFTESEESESEDDGEDNEEKQIRRAERELRLIRNKLKSLKNKLEAAKKERKNLRDIMKKNQHALKEEKKKYKSLQKEVNKMAALMKDDEDEDEEEEEEKEEVEEEEEEESEESTESESSEEETESESEDESASLETKKENVTMRVKRHENCLNALKKGNYMLKANVDRLQDDLSKHKEMVVGLQEDLNSVLAELE